MPLCTDFKSLIAISGDEVNVHDEDYLAAVIGCLSYLKDRGNLPADFDCEGSDSDFEKHLNGQDFLHHVQSFKLNPFRDTPSRCTNGAVVFGKQDKK